MNYEQAKQELDALPVWVRQLVLGASGRVLHGMFRPDRVGFQIENAQGFHLCIRGDKWRQNWMDGFEHLLRLADAVQSNRKKRYAK